MVKNETVLLIFSTPQRGRIQGRSFFGLPALAERVCSSRFPAQPRQSSTPTLFPHRISEAALAQFLNEAGIHRVRRIAARQRAE